MDLVYESNQIFTIEFSLMGVTRENEFLQKVVPMCHASKDIKLERRYSCQLSMCNICHRIIGMLYNLSK